MIIKKIYVLIICVLITSCVGQKIISEKIELKFLDEYVYPANMKVEGMPIGGLSGIDFYKNNYFIAVDDPKTPRVYKAKISIENYKIDTVKFLKVIFFNKKKHSFFADNHLDLESVVAQNNQLIISSEGSVNKGKDPFIFKSDMAGNFKETLQLPNKFLANSNEKPMHNGVFEGLSKSYNEKGYWSAIEFPLKSDGKIPAYNAKKTPVRFTFFNAKTGRAEKEFAYELEPLSRPEKGLFNLNGLTDILEYKKNNFLVIERTYQSGYTGNENLVKIYKAVINKRTTDVLKNYSLASKKYVPMQKELLFDFTLIKSKLTENTIDNIEGITFGPILPNGNKSLILISDDNFQAYGKQLNQFLLFEIIHANK